MKHLAITVALALGACSPNVETRGHLKDADWREHIAPEKTTQDEVLQLLGSPSARSSFGPDTWYYITTRRESFAFFKPKVTDEEVVQITFHADNTVKAVETTGKDKARDIAIADRITPTEGHQMTFMEQLLGNLGRFNAPGGGTGGGGGGNRHGGPGGSAGGRP